MCEDCNQTEPSRGRLYAEKLAADREQLRRGEGCAAPERPMTDEEIVALLFTYHPPTERTLPKFAAIRQAGKNFAEIVLANCPQSSDRLTVINHIREAVMFANAAISLDGRSLYR